MDKKKQQVIMTAKKLFKSKGYNETSVQDIINESMISKGTFYNYFSSKNEFIMTYLKMVREEEASRRIALLQGNDPADQDVFVEQILVRMEMATEFTLRPIFEGAFHSEDKELKQFIQGRLIEEISWLAARITDLYGENSIKYASDCAVITHGMIQNMLYVWKVLERKPINMTFLIQYIVRRLDDIMLKLIGSDDQFLQDVSLIEWPDFKELKRLKQLISGKRNNEALNEHIDFLVDELKGRSPRIHLVQSSINACKMLVETAEEKSLLEDIEQRFMQL